MTIFALYYALLLFAPILAITNPFPAYRSAQSLPRFWPFLNIVWLVCRYVQRFKGRTILSYKLRFRSHSFLRELRAADTMIKINLQFVFASKTYKQNKTRPAALLKDVGPMKYLLRSFSRTEFRYIRAMDGGDDGVNEDPEAGRMESLSERMSRKTSRNPATNAERAKEAFRNVIRSRIPNQRAEAEFENFCALCEEERYLRE